jgi:hypothetical protein
MSLYSPECTLCTTQAEALAASVTDACGRDDAALGSTSVAAATTPVASLLRPRGVHGACSAAAAPHTVSGAERLFTWASRDGSSGGPAPLCSAAAAGARVVRSAMEGARKRTRGGYGGGDDCEGGGWDFGGGDTAGRLLDSPEARALRAARDVVQWDGAVSV